MKEKIISALTAVKNAFSAYKTGFKYGLPCEKLFENFTDSLTTELKNYYIKYDYLCGKDSVNIDGISKGVFLNDGDTVLMDVSVYYGGVWCDVTRTFFVGEITAEQEKTFELVAESLRAGGKALKACVKAEKIYNAVNGVYKKAGKSLVHHAGHRIGDSYLLEPQFVKNNKEILKPFDLVAVESGLYEGFGIRLENDYFITANGAEDLFEELMPLNIKEYILR